MGITNLITFVVGYATFTIAKGYLNAFQDNDDDNNNDNINSLITHLLSYAVYVWLNATIYDTRFFKVEYLH